MIETPQHQGNRRPGQRAGLSVPEPSLAYVIFIFRSLSLANHNKGGKLFAGARGE